MGPGCVPSSSMSVPPQSSRTTAGASCVEPSCAALGCFPRVAGRPSAGAPGRGGSSRAAAATMTTASAQAPSTSVQPVDAQVQARGAHERRRRRRPARTRAGATSSARPPRRWRAPGSPRSVSGRWGTRGRSRAGRRPPRRPDPPEHQLEQRVEQRARSPGPRPGTWPPAVCSWPPGRRRRPRRPRLSASH